MSKPIMMGVSFVLLIGAAGLLVPAAPAAVNGAAMQEDAATENAGADTRSADPHAHEGWSQLSLSTCRVDEFLRQNPTSDGRGVIIAVLDTGVEVAVPGLTHTPDGETKFVDVQDCTGQGDLDLHWVNANDDGSAVVEYDDDGVAVEYALPKLPTSNETRRYWFGYFDERTFVNSDVSDLNDNGSKTDRFAVLVTAFEGDGDDQAVCYIDTDLDRSFADEKELKSYHVRQDTFTLHRAAPEDQIEPVTFEINIFLRQRKVVVHYDDGAHGTHVAGIAGGYQINQQPDFHGVAPGAKMMSLKIGKNSVGGVSSTAAMKKAFEHGARYAREHQVPIVFNMSYGVESVLEGNSDIDRFVDDFLKENPYLVFCTSAGNEGPGVSSVGTPSAASQAIAVGALLAQSSGRDVQGYDIDGPAVATVFTSRGGEVAKPDVSAPGWSTSTVPRYVERGDYWAGTSMASPYVAGLCALLISDAQQKNPGVPVRGCDVRRALWLSAEPLPDTTQLDIGYGVPNMLKAAELLDGFVKAAAQGDPVIGYDISTPCPTGPDGSAPAAFWRTTCLPVEDRHTFTITPIFAPLTDTADRIAFTRKFTLRSNTPWCKLTQEEVYLRSSQAARVFVEYDESALQTPGLHVGTVDALWDGQLAFRLINTVVVPHRFTAAENFTHTFKNQTVHGWLPDRYFLAVPPGASTMKLTLRAPEGEDSRASCSRIYDPVGRRYVRRTSLDTRSARDEAEWILDDELMPGVWEIPVLANRPDRDWPYDFEVRFFGLDAQPAVVTSWKEDLYVTNLFEEPLPATLEGKLEGYRKHDEAKFEGLNDELTYSVELEPPFSRLRLKLEMTPEAYATTTDIGVSVETPDGEAIFFDAFSNRTLETVVNPRGHKNLKVVVRAGFAVDDDKRETPMTVNIDYLLGNPMDISVEQGGSNVAFLPATAMKLDYKLRGAKPDAPKGTKPVGFIRVREQSTGDTALLLPLDFTAK
jgi:tripeptidyl-peptidase-2